MKDTCDIKNCIVAKKLKIKKPEECFNFVESWWTPEGKKEPTIVKDCSPKRTFIMIQELYNRLIGVQKSQEQMRNEYNKTQTVMNLLTENIQLNFKRILPQTLELENIEKKEIKLLKSYGKE